MDRGKSIANRMTNGPRIMSSFFIQENMMGLRVIYSGNPVAGFTSNRGVSSAPKGVRSISFITTKLKDRKLSSA